METARGKRLGRRLSVRLDDRQAAARLIILIGQRAPTLICAAWPARQSRRAGRTCKRSSSAPGLSTAGIANGIKPPSAPAGQTLASS
jgi:hypothetical protein